MTIQKDKKTYKESVYKRKMNTSVTMLSMPSMRLDVPNLDGFPDTADKTFWTNARSWMGSAQIGPPSYREERHSREVFTQLTPDNIHIMKINYY